MTTSILIYNTEQPGILQVKKNYNKDDPFEQVNTYGCNQKTVGGSQNRVSKRRKTESALCITRDCGSIVSYQ